jgi:hypothetical protein
MFYLPRAPPQRVSAGAGKSVYLPKLAKAFTLLAG